MDHAVVLNIGTGANPNVIHITPNDRAKPNAATFADHHIPNYIDSWGNIGMIADDRKRVFVR
jgi:hypothetical protein